MMLPSAKETSEPAVERARADNDQEFLNCSFTGFAEFEEPFPLVWTGTDDA